MKKIDFSLVLAKAAFQIVPTILIVGYLGILYAGTIGELHSDPRANWGVFTAGLLLSFFLYSYNVRFSVTFLLLIGLLFAIYKFLGSATFGEFDAFYYSISFFIYAAIFIVAWAVGFAFARYTFFPWVAAIAVFVFAVTFVVNDFLNLQSQLQAGYVRWISDALLTQQSLMHRLVTLLFLLILPVLFYSIFIVSMNEFLRKLTTFSKQHFQYLLRRSLITTAILILILLAPLVYVYFFDLPESFKEQLSSAEANSANFLKKTYNQSTRRPQFDLQDYAQLLPEVKLSDETVFCTYIDNFFPLESGGQLPLPVHFRRFVLNRYEPQNEKFVLDPYPPSAIPNDLFSPAIEDIPIGFSVKDSLIETSTRQYDYRRNISATVYNQTLDPDAYVAPNTGYYYQKLPVAPEDRETFTTVYQCSSLISIWNLPPFVYSSTRPELVEFRDQRAEALRLDSFGDYARLDSTFLAYFTEIDTTDTLIINLARSLTAGKKTPYDKLDSIVEYFLGNTEDGTPRFTYTLKPGAPQDPNQSFMHYFLFENKKGYCTYFAGATSLLLRAAGIPCRVVVGYAIFDRSNKNTGWYWVYADQGHAWVEVYFPTYGWVDFDTTPSDDTEPVRPPKPDATPPDFAREPVFAVLGKVTGMTTDSTNVLVRPYSIRYRSEMYEIPEAEAQIISLQPRDGSVTIEDQKVKIGEFPLDRTMVLSAYSFDYQLEQLRPYDTRKPFMGWFVNTFPEQIPVDEAIIVYKDETTPEGTIFAVDGRVQELSSDSSGLTVIPSKIFYRDRTYPIEPRKAEPLRLKPEEAVVYVEDEKRPLSSLAVGDSLLVKAESGHPSLHAIRPFLATESFDSWFKNSFPEIIPVNRVTLQVDKPPFVERFVWGVLIASGIVLLLLLLLAVFVYGYFHLRVRYSKDPARLYWLYLQALMLLNQLGFHRVIKTPLEYAHQTIDPRFDTQLSRFVSLYQKAKYAPAGVALAADEQQFVEQFSGDFRQKVFSRYSRWEVLRNFANFIRTLRFLFVK